MIGNLLYFIIKNYTYQILSAIDYLHRRAIVNISFLVINL